MAVYKKTYRRYDGELTPAWSRLLVIPRYSIDEMLGSKLYVTFLLAALLPSLIAALIIYLRYNASALDSLGINPSSILNIDAGFFMSVLGWQSMAGFLVAAFRGPGLVSPDLTNNALPLYLARPFTRVEYVTGKLSVLALLLSVMTWIPSLLLFALQCYLEGWNWMVENARIGVALFVGSWVWILVLSLITLALSAWVKWRPVAGGLLFVLLFAGAAFANASVQILEVPWGHMINLTHLIGTVWLWLFNQPVVPGAGAAFFRVQLGESLPDWSVCAALVGFCVVSLWLLAKRIRGVEVVS